MKPKTDMEKFAEEIAMREGIEYQTVLKELMKSKIDASFDPFTPIGNKFIDIINEAKNHFAKELEKSTNNSKTLDNIHNNALSILATAIMIFPPAQRERALEVIIARLPVLEVVSRVSKVLERKK